MQPSPNDGGGVKVAEGPETGPRRRCLVTREVREKDELIRFVVGPEAQLVPDLDGRLPGRGLWVAARRQALERAVAGGLFAKAAGRRVVVPGDLALQVEEGLRRRILGLLGLARRAGQVAAGYEQVRQWLAAGRVGVLLEAADGAPGGRQKLAAGAKGVPVVDLFEAMALGQALGRERVVHVAVARGRIALRLAAMADRLALFGAGTMKETDAA